MNVKGSGEAVTYQATNIPVLPGFTIFYLPNNTQRIISGKEELRCFADWNNKKPHQVVLRQHSALNINFNFVLNVSLETPLEKKTWQLSFSLPPTSRLASNGSTIKPIVRSLQFLIEVGKGRTALCRDLGRGISAQTSRDLDCFKVLSATGTIRCLIFGRR